MILDTFIGRYNGAQTRGEELTTAMGTSGGSAPSDFETYP